MLTSAYLTAHSTIKIVSTAYCSLKAMYPFNMIRSLEATGMYGHCPLFIANTIRRDCLNGLFVFLQAEVGIIGDDRLI